jgi:hypothetical protein
MSSLTGPMGAGSQMMTNARGSSGRVVMDELRSPTIGRALQTSWHARLDLTKRFNGGLLYEPGARFDDGAAAYGAPGFFFRRGARLFQP